MLGGTAEGLGLGRGVLDLLGFCLSAPSRFLRLPGGRQEHDAERPCLFSVRPTIAATVSLRGKAPCLLRRG